MKPQADTSLLRPGLRLAALAAIVALVLAAVWHAVEEPINTRRIEAERQRLEAVLPALAHDNDLLASAFVIDPAANQFTQVALLGFSEARSGWRATLQGQPSGVVLPLATDAGFNGRIELLIGIDTEGRITGVSVISHNETEGLGAAIADRESRWMQAFANRSLANTPAVLWQVKKDGGDFDQWVGATITPRAVVRAIHGALLFFEENRASLLQAQ